ILPYVEAPESHMGFFKGGTFADFRKKHDVEQGRDPIYASEENEMMQPWMTPLSNLGNHQTVIYYDAKLHAIGMCDQESGGSSDPWHDEQRRRWLDEGGGVGDVG